MSSVFTGSKVTVTRFCGRSLVSDETSRLQFAISSRSNAIAEQLPFVLTESEAKEAVIVLQAALIDWRGDI